MTYKISVTTEPPDVDLHAARVVALVTRVLVSARVKDGAEVSVVFSDDATVQALNRDYRGVNQPTDVLSFGLSDVMRPVDESPTDSDGFPLPPDAGLQLGEVIVSVETAVRQAREHQRAIDHELAHLVVHGALHLLGHDHAEPEEEREMRACEDDALVACGFPPGTAGWSH